MIAYQLQSSAQGDSNIAVQDVTSTTVQNTAAEELTSDVADPPIGIDPVTPNCGDESELHNVLVVFANLV